MSDDILTIEQVEHLEHLQNIADSLARVRADRRLRKERHMPTHRRRTKYGPANDD